jgi:hypothetical protein
LRAWSGLAMGGHGLVHFFSGLPCARTTPDLRGRHHGPADTIPVPCIPATTICAPPVPLRRERCHHSLFTHLTILSNALGQTTIGPTALKPSPPGLNRHDQRQVSSQSTVHLMPHSLGICSSSIAPTSANRETHTIWAGIKLWSHFKVVYRMASTVATDIAASSAPCFASAPCLVSAPCLRLTRYQGRQPPSRTVRV